MKNNVTQTVKDKICTSCGICEAVCPSDAIKLSIDGYGIYTPMVDADRCTDCGMCLKVCAGRAFDYTHFMEKIHGGIPKNVTIGPVLDIYAGRAVDAKVLDMAQSGGFISALLIHGLEQKLFDGAVVTAWDEENPFRPEVYVARNRTEVLKAVGSKYNPVPVAAIAGGLMEMEGTYAFVGTPCQIQAMRKAEETIPGLAEKISLYIGLHCLAVFNYHYLDHMMHKIKKDREAIRYFRYRDKSWRGWPCDMNLKTHNGESIDLPGDYSRLQARSYFSNWRCRLCFDKFNEFSDVSCGDCRIPGQYDVKKIGDAYYSGMALSDIVVRTERAKNIVEQMISEGVLEVNPSKVEDIIKTVAVTEKKLGVRYASAFINGIGGCAPEYGVGFDVEDSKKNFKYKLCYAYSVLAMGHYYLCHYLSKFGWFRWVLKRTPHKWLWRLEKIREKPANYRRLRSIRNIKLVKTDDAVLKK